jgi:acetyl-CoA/propionyl-CoA carboxylase biotin carboxyl carrier protein
VANRGEIAVRVIRTLRRLGIRSVAVYSDPDAAARHVLEADEAVRLGPAAARESYLDISRVLEAAARTGSQAIHPGYGFLSENPDFAAACERAGVAFLGPPARAIEVMGDKITAKNAVAAFDVPVVPGVAKPGLTDDELVAAADEVGYPVLIKPSAGGGGKGMRLVDDPARLREALQSARREAASSFGDDTLFLERFVLRPRHIEVQVLADAQPARSWRSRRTTSSCAAMRSRPGCTRRIRHADFCRPVGGCCKCSNPRAPECGSIRRCCRGRSWAVITTQC